MPIVAMVSVAQVRVLLGESERVELDRLVSVLLSGSGRGGGGEGGDTIARETWNDVKVHHGSHDPAGMSHDPVQVRVDAMVGGECLYCGERMIDSIQLPFIPSSQRQEALDSWK